MADAHKTRLVKMLAVRGMPLTSTATWRTVATGPGLAFAELGQRFQVLFTA